MSNDFDQRLNQILARITANDFLHGRGLGNEIPFYAFDYPPEQELAVRAHIAFLLEQIPKHRPNLHIAHVDLFSLIIDTLKARNFFNKALEMQRQKGNAALLKALAAPLAAGKLAAALLDQTEPGTKDVVLVSGIGSAYPLLRTHNLLNNLHAGMGSTPLVLFYPGVYDGQSLRLFGILQDTPYYRAFRLVD